MGPRIGVQVVAKKQKWPPLLEIRLQHYPWPATFLIVQTFVLCISLTPPTPHLWKSFFPVLSPCFNDAGLTYLILYILHAPDTQNCVYYQLVALNTCKTITPTCFGYTHLPSSGSTIKQWKYVVLGCTVITSTWHWLIDWFALGLSPYGPDAPRPYHQALCAPYSDISSGEPCPFTKSSRWPPDLKS